MTLMHAHDSPNATAEETALSVEGMSCASCVARVENAAKKIPGVEATQVNLALGRAHVRFDPRKVTPQLIAQAITDAGYPAAPQTTATDTATEEDHRLHRQHAHARSWLRRAVVGMALWFPVELTHWIMALTGAHAAHIHGLTWMDWTALGTSTIAIVYVGWAFYAGALKALRRGTTDMDTLISMGASVAYGYSLVSMLG